MGLFSDLFSKKHTAAEGTQSQMQAPPPQEPPKKKGIVKTQRFILEDIESHMKDIMELVDKNEDYKLKKRDLIEEGRAGEKIYKYELNTQAVITPISCMGG